MLLHRRKIVSKQLQHHFFRKVVNSLFLQEKIHVLVQSPPHMFLLTAQELKAQKRRNTDQLTRLESKNIHALLVPFC